MLGAHEAHVYARVIIGIPVSDMKLPFGHSLSKVLGELFDELRGCLMALFGLLTEKSRW